MFALCYRTVVLSVLYVSVTLVYCGQTAAWIKMKLGTEVHLAPDDIVLDGDQLTSPKGGHSSPQFSAHVLRPNGWMDQDATWYGGQPLPRRRCVRWGRPQFSVHVWPNGWMDEDATWYGGRPRPRTHCIRRGPSSSRKGQSSPTPLFGPCQLWPRWPISATVDLLLQLLKHSTNSPTYTTVDHCCPIKTHIHDVRRSQSF